MNSKPCARPRNLEAELLDFEAAGALLGFSGRTVRRMVDRGDFVAAITVPGVRGKRLRRADIMAWLGAISHCSLAIAPAAAPARSVEVRAPQVAGRADASSASPSAESVAASAG